MNKVEVIPLPGVPEVKEGADLGKLVLEAVDRNRLSLLDRDVVVVKHKVVSKSEGRIVALNSVTPGPKAILLAKRQGKDPRLVELILQEAVRVVREGHGVIITETRHGLVCANSGIDQSNVGQGFAALLPLDPDKSANQIRATLESATGKALAVVVSDTFGRPWRLGQTDVAIGCSGIAPLVKYAGKTDPYGYRLRVTEPAVVDEIAGAAELAIGKLNGIPLAIVRGAEYTRDQGGIRGLIMPAEKDLFR